MIEARFDDVVCVTEKGNAYIFHDSSEKSGQLVGFSNIKSVVATDRGIMGLKKDGTCISTNSGYSSVFAQHSNDWRNIIQIAGWEGSFVGLREDGSCVACWRSLFSEHYEGQCDVSSWRDITSIACGSKFTIGLKKDGTVVCAGQVPVSLGNWKNVALIAAAYDSAIGITKDNEILCAGEPIRTLDIGGAKNIVDLMIIHGTAYALLADGTVLGKNCEKLKDVVAMAASPLVNFFLKKDGTIEEISWSTLNRDKLPHNITLFQNYDDLIEREMKREQETREQWIKEAQERAARIAQQAAYREAGVCQHCGGEFMKALFGIKCKSCGKRKDYN